MEKLEEKEALKRMEEALAQPHEMRLEKTDGSGPSGQKGDLTGGAAERPGRSLEQTGEEERWQ